MVESSLKLSEEMSQFVDNGTFDITKLVNDCFDEDLANEQEFRSILEMLRLTDLENNKSVSSSTILKPEPIINHDNSIERSSNTSTHDYTLDHLTNLDIHNLFVLYDNKYFGSVLQTCGTIVWSNRLKKCAGLTKYMKHNVTITYQGVIQPTQVDQFEIQLSTPILQYRPYNDIVSTLLHEMIHAYLAKTGQCDNHGPTFQRYAGRIGLREGVLITTFHNFYEEVNYVNSKKPVKPRTRKTPVAKPKRTPVAKPRKTTLVK